METGQDAIRDELINSPSPEDQGGEQVQPDDDRFKLDGSWKKTFDRNTYFFYKDGENEIEKSLKNKAESGKKKGVDPLPTNLNGNRFPLALIKPTIDSLGDWQANLLPIYGSYPNIDSKSGFTQKPIYPDEVSKPHFDRNKVKNEPQPVIERIKTRKEKYDKFKDYAGKQFTHLLDYFSAQNGLGALREIPTGDYKDGKTTEANTKDIYLGSFIKTFDDNEDPTYFGYDIKIKYLDSPLFNDTAEIFIKQFSDFGNSEIRARGELLQKFKEQFYRFLRTDIDSVSPKFNGGDGVKTYYLRKLSGINKLVESYDGDTGKQFVDYTKDFITLTFNEDVTQNIGYLSSLYKAIAYSRLNGKLILPENVLRFDAEIEITEVRKFNRLIKNLDNSIEYIADRISKYTYTLYECQFFFPSLPHGDSLDMSAITEASEFEIKFNWKWSSLKFSKFTYNNTPGTSASFAEYSVNNAYIVPTAVRPNETKNAEINNEGSIQAQQNTEDKESLGKTSAEGESVPAPNQKDGTPLQEVKEAEKTKNNEAPTPTEGVTDTTNAAVEPQKSQGDSMKKKLSDSANQSATEDKLTAQSSTSNVEVQKRLEEVDKATTFPENKGFSLGILGGQLGKVAGELTSGIAGTKNLITDRLGEVASSIINPTNKGFNLNILGGQVGSLVGSLGGNLGKSFDSFKSRLSEVAESVINPKNKGFSLDILGKELSNLVSKPGNNSKNIITQTLAKAKETLIDSGIKTINNSLNSQASLLNKTLANITKQKGPISDLLKKSKNKTIESAKNFVGKSLRSFFTKK